MKNKGFTLIEMLVAVGLVALMGVICWRGLAYLANQRAAIEQETTELAQLVRAFAQLEMDLAARLPDIALPPRATSAELPLAIGIASMSDGNAQIEIVRSVATGVAQSRSLRVLYHVDARGLVRSTDADDVLVLPGAARLQVRVQAGGFWLETGQGQAGVRPFTRAGALEVVVADRDGTRYVRVLAL